MGYVLGEVAALSVANKVGPLAVILYSFTTCVADPLVPLIPLPLAQAKFKPVIAVVEVQLAMATELLV